MTFRITTSSFRTFSTIITQSSTTPSTSSSTSTKPLFSSLRCLPYWKVASPTSTTLPYYKSSTVLASNTAGHIGSSSMNILSSAESHRYMADSAQAGSGSAQGRGIVFALFALPVS
jgi:hypothetical protein